MAGDEYAVNELVLEDCNIHALNSKTLNERVKLLANADFTNETFAYAHQFATADCIVIAAPYWDSGFPTMLKAYIEAISINGIVYRYDEQGNSVGLCRADALYYVTTRGGYVGDENDLGFATIAQLAMFYGIENAKCISAEGLDIVTNDAEKIVEQAIAGDLIP
jgi:FMN-dependent NADH-azoreductase